MHRDFGLTRKKQLSFLDNYLIFRALSVIRMRLERMTVCLEGRCSIQLSYRTDWRIYGRKVTKFS